MTASGEELRASSVIGGTCSEMLQTVFLFFKILNALETAKIGDSRDAWNIADRPILADPNKNTSTHVFSNIFDNSALISHLSRHVSQQVGE